MHDPSAASPGPAPAPTPRRSPTEIGLAIVGAGRVGLIRGEIAARFPAVRWIGIAELIPERGREAATRIGADFVTTDHRDLLRRSEVNAVIVATEGHRHTDPVLAALEHPGRPALLVEKPIATSAVESERVLAAIRAAGVDAVLGYTQRFRRRWLVAKEKVASGALGEVTTVSTRAFLNRLLGVNNYRKAGVTGESSPMTVSGTHVLDLVRWFMAGRVPVEVYARSVDRVLGPPFGGIDGTAAIVTYDDGAVHSSVVNWALPTSWPGAVYSLEVGIVGTDGVLTIDDTHRDAVLAVSSPQGMGYVGDPTRLVDFVGSYPPGDMALGALRGPMHEETNAWLSRVAMGTETHHATAEDGHALLMLSKALDRSARLGRPLRLPISAEEADATAGDRPVTPGLDPDAGAGRVDSPAANRQPTVGSTRDGQDHRGRADRPGGR